MTCQQYLKGGEEPVQLGIIRPSMKDNILLKRPELEKSFSGGHLPNIQFTYGMPNRRNGGTADALNNWDVVPKTCTVQTKRKKDFLGMNKSAVCLGLSRSSEHMRFRCCHPMTVPQKKPRKGVPLKVDNLSVTHGIRMRPSTPIHDILSYKFSRDFIKATLIQDEKKRAICEKQTQPSVIGKIIHTKKSEMAVFHPKSAPDPKIKPSPKYSHVKAQLDTFSSESLRCSAIVKQIEREKLREEEKMKEYLQHQIESLNEAIPVKLRSRSIQNPKRANKIYGSYYFDPNTGAKREDPNVRVPPPSPRLPKPWKPSPIVERLLTE